MVNVPKVIVVVNMVGVEKPKNTVLLMLDVNLNLDNVLKLKKLPNYLRMGNVVMDMVDVQKVNAVVNMAGVVILKNIVLLIMAVNQNMVYVIVILLLKLVNVARALANVLKVNVVVNTVGVVKMKNIVELDAKVNLVNAIK